jgi:hypothetical protein
VPVAVQRHRRRGLAELGLDRLDARALGDEQARAGVAKVVALRTRRSLLPQIIGRAKREHPYEVPSVVAVPIIDGGPDYIGWILELTEGSER